MTRAVGLREGRRPPACRERRRLDYQGVSERLSRQVWRARGGMPEPSRRQGRYSRATNTRNVPITSRYIQRETGTAPSAAGLAVPDSVRHANAKRSNARSESTSLVSTPAQRSLAIRPACSLHRDCDTLPSKSLTDSLPPPPLHSYRPERTSCRAGIVPTENQHLSTAHTTSEPKPLYRAPSFLAVSLSLWHSAMTPF